MLATGLLFLSSGLFLGWSLGANDAANVFGSAVGSRMLRFTTALAAALTVTWMTRAGLPVSSTQAVVGAIVGWNWFSGSATNLGQLSRIVGIWVFCPLLAALAAAGLYLLGALLLRRTRPHLLRLDAGLRLGLILAGVFGSYSLGANNIGNVMGVFVPAAPFPAVNLPGGLMVSGTQQLFLLGGLAIATGVYTQSRRVMLTVGQSLMPLSPFGALVVVLANALVLFVFSSQELANALAALGLPPIPLIPVSSSQAAIGAVVGVALLQGRRGLRQVRWGVLLRIASGWVTTPVLAALLGYLLLFVVQNVFGQVVVEPLG